MMGSVAVYAFLDGAIESLAGVGPWEYDGESQILRLSPWLAKLLDVKAGASTSDLYVCIHPEDREKWCETMVAASSQFESGQVILRVGPAGMWETLVAVSYRSFPNAQLGLSMSGMVVDITDAKRAEWSSQANIERMTLALRAGHEGIWDWDLRTNQAYFSSDLRHMLGYSPEDHWESADNWVQYCHLEDRVPTMRALAAHLNGETPVYRMEHRIRHRNGSYRWMFARGSALRDENGTPYRMIGVSRDITERKNLRLALEERDQLLRAAVEGSLNAFFLFRSIRDHDGRIEDFEVVDLNESACQLTGVRRSNAIGKTLLTAFHGTLLIEQFPKYCVVADSRRTDTTESADTDGNGNRRWLYQQVVAVRDGISVTIADISESRRSEEAAKESHLLVEKIASSIPELVYIFDIAERKCTYRNRSLMNLLGFAPEDAPMLDMETLMRVTHPDDRAQLRDYLIETSTDYGEAEHQIELRLVEASGRIQWKIIRTIVFQRDETGKPTHLMGSCQDITPQKEIEIRLRHQMVQLEAVKRELLERQQELESLNGRLEELATRDGLTGVFNHRALHERLSVEVARARRHGEPLSLIIADVDDFKIYNDRYGHPAGDVRLREFVQAFVQEVRAEDFIARYGGEEFVVVFPNTRVSEAVVTAERILRALNAYPGDQRITASFGCAELDPVDGSMAQLISEADRALYVAKRAGKNCIRVFQPETAS